MGEILFQQGKLYYEIVSEWDFIPIKWRLSKEETSFQDTGKPPHFRFGPDYEYDTCFPGVNERLKRRVRVTVEIALCLV